MKSALALLAIPISLFAAESPRLASQFDADRAMQHVRKQVEFGPRPSGSDELKRTREYLVSALQSYGLDVRKQEFTRSTPRGEIQFVNIQAGLVLKSAGFSILSRPRDRILIASHYDTKWLPGIRFVGANDGASSTAVLLEIGRVVAQAKFRPRDADVELVFFDGEEAVEQYTDTDGLYGSRFFVRDARTSGSLARIRAMILMDMVGDRDLSIQIPEGDSRLTQKVFESARALGFREYFHLMNRLMVDDHTPFAEENIPAVDLIDFEYGPGNRWWHTAEDSLDKIRADSLKIVGQTVLRLLERL